MEEEMTSQRGSPGSFAADTAPSSCHSHTLEFVTTSKPMKPNTYSLLRRASIRTLSCEQLPRGLTAGRIFFEDPAVGYTIAYKFQLVDPYARGHQRHYALLALAGHDPGRAFKATTIVWRAFEQLHRSFVALLQCLGRQFGGVVVEPPMSDQELEESYCEGHDDEDEESAENFRPTPRMPSTRKPVAVA
ncbi:hypothetical protein G7Y79_00016g041030 [Physcia stellaris]|nr:hypothetical protein G7Y79_00016g041030 [Physcia stellaris]